MAGSFDLTGETGLERDRSDRDRARERGIDAVRYRRGLAGTAAFLAVWWAAARGQPTYLLPGPIEVLAALRVEVVSGALFVHLGQSLLHYLPGVAAGVVSGGALGIAMGWDRRLDDVLTPVTRVLRPIPPLAWIVFAIAWFGLGHLGAAFIVFIGAFWITFYSAYGGVETVPRTQMEAAASLGVDDDWALLRRVVVPDAAPQLLTGVRTSVGQCWMMVIAAELFGAPGIGYEIITSANNLAMDRSVAYMLTISAVFLLSDRLVRRVRARVVG